MAQQASACCSEVGRFGQAVFTDSDAPGFGVLFIFMSPLPLLLMVVGTVAALVRAVLRLRRRRAEERARPS